MDFTFFDAVIMGIIQGVTEFLPVSSSGHLAIAPHIFGFEDPGLSYSVALHFGTLIAALIYFRRDLFDLSCMFFLRQKSSMGFSPSMPWLFLLATIPVVIAGFFVASPLEASLRDPFLVSLFVVVSGGVLWFADRFSSRVRSLSDLSVPDALIVGFSQMIALLPGVSRSGATMSAGLFLGFSRKDAARFSFLLSLPVIFGATFFEFSTLLSSPFSWLILVGVGVSFIFSYFSIVFFLRLIEHIHYRIFFWYSLLLAVGVYFFA